MNKGDAIRALHDGKKICHRLFSPTEWIGARNETYYKDEQGCSLGLVYFWERRNSHAWEDGWSVWEGKL